VVVSPEAVVDPAAPIVLPLEPLLVPLPLVVSVLELLPAAVLGELGVVAPAAVLGAVEEAPLPVVLPAPWAVLPLVLPPVLPLALPLPVLGAVLGLVVDELAPEPVDGEEDEPDEVP
jgi:hypothetical protein